MPSAIETRLAQLEELVHPGARERAETVQRTTAERAALMAERYASATARRDRAQAAHPAAAKEFRTAVAAAVDARTKLAALETEIEDALRDQLDAASRLGVEVATFIPRVATADFSYLVGAIDEQLAEIARRATA